MNEELSEKNVAVWDESARIEPGGRGNVYVDVSESYSGMTLKIPIHVRRAKADGPVVFVTAALHGDEINGTGAVRRLIQDETLDLVKGSVIFVPVLNLLSFDRHSRYLPDRRDLNRCFPGSASGSLASRMALTLFEEIVGRCDYGIDLHTAAARRTNYPTIRGDLSNKIVHRMATAFGSELVIDGKGPKGSFRREATNRGCPTIVLECGEVCKVEPTLVETTIHGVKNVLRELGMLEGELRKPAYQIIVKQSKWIRAEHGGFLQFHVQPGDIVEKDQPLATNTDLLGTEYGSLFAPFNSIVIGMTTLPAVSPGEPVVHLAKLLRSTKVHELRDSRTRNLEERVKTDLASNIMVVEHSPADDLIERLR